MYPSLCSKETPHSGDAVQDQESNKVSASLLDGEGETPLTYACLAGDIGVVQCLIERQAKDL